MPTWKKRKSYSRPAKKSYTRARKYVKRKTAKKSNSRTHMSMSFQRGFITPDSTFIKLRYMFSGNDGSGSAVYVDHVMRGNSCYDSDYTYAGHQPSGYDQYSALYNLCTVVGSKIKVTTFNGSSALQILAIYPSTSPTMDYSSETLSIGEVPYSVTDILQSNVYAGNKKVWKGQYMSSAKILATSVDQVKNQNQYGHNSSGNPTYSWFWHVVNASSSGTLASLGVYQKIEVVYYCIFKQRAEVLVS